MHYVLRGPDITLVPEYADESCGFARCSLIDASVGSVHTGLGLCSLTSGGHVNRHIHSFEELFYVLEGSPTLVIDREAYRLAPGVCGVIPVGIQHAWAGPALGAARWIDMLSPQPRTNGGAADTFFVGEAAAHEAREVDVRDPRLRHLFRMTNSDIELESLKGGTAVDAPTVSASMNTALLAYSGIALKMLVDQRLGAELSSMFMVEYQPGGIAHPHDHPLEEAYFMLEGEIEAVADDRQYVLRAGDVFWTGVGCIHAFRNTSGNRVRWLETQSPPLPARYGYRFNRDWEYLQEKVAGRDAHRATLAR
jgi:quercetin dioxygenase-like cupin family protein